MKKNLKRLSVDIDTIVNGCIMCHDALAEENHPNVFIDVDPFEVKSMATETIALHDTSDWHSQDFWVNLTDARKLHRQTWDEDPDDPHLQLFSIVAQVVWHYFRQLESAWMEKKHQAMQDAKE